MGQCNAAVQPNKDLSANTVHNYKSLIHMVKDAILNDKNKKFG
jgi:hypothetical protein